MPEGFRPRGLGWCGSGAHEVLLLPHAGGGACLHEAYSFW
jgi:hypothetical protein